jgi:hypothetical protein
MNVTTQTDTIIDTSKRQFKVGLIMEKLVTWTVQAENRDEALKLVKEDGFGRPAGEVGPIAREWLVQDMSDPTDENLHTILGGPGAEVRDTGLVNQDGRAIIVKE